MLSRDAEPAGDSLDLGALAAGLAERLAPLLRHDPEQMLDRAALAARLGLGERTVSSLAARGELPGGFLLGGCRRWRWEDVLKHLQARSGRKPRRGRGRYSRQPADDRPAPDEQATS
jgi:hypothetical protein